MLPCFLSKSDSAKGQLSACKWKESEFLDMTPYSCKDHMGPSWMPVVVTIRLKHYLSVNEHLVEYYCRLLGEPKSYIS